MKNFLTILLITIGINAKTVTGTITSAYDEENVLPWVGIKVNGKENWYIYDGKPSSSVLNKRKGQKIKMTLDKNNEGKKIVFLNNL